MEKLEEKNGPEAGYRWSHSVRDITPAPPRYMTRNQHKPIKITGHAHREDLIWNLSRASRVRPMVGALDDPHLRRLGTEVLDRFERDLQPLLHALPAQVIHNDLNPYNVLMTSDLSSIAGVIDFGDMLFAPRVVDLAVAASYQIIATQNELNTLIQCAAAYNSVVPPTVDELAVLFDLVIVRLVMLLAITAWRAREHPGEGEYILRNTHGAGQSVIALWESSRAEARRRLTQECQIWNT